LRVEQAVHKLGTIAALSTGIVQRASQKSLCRGAVNNLYPAHSALLAGT
jgi:hypothetical protein